MADVITSFKLETTQYDSKLRDAAKGLADYAHAASFAGNEFDKFTKNNADAARALGGISTSATNAKDKVKELVGAYNQAANAYNALTKEQQQSDWGKALAESIQKLKGRITEAKQELYSMGDSSKSTSGIMAAFKEKLTINIDALKLLNVGLQGAKAALGVAKDAFFASEASVDEWGRVVKSAEGVYEGFLNALNTGDISGYLDRMNEIVQAARTAYDEMDKLGTMKTIQAPQFSKQEAENNRLRTMLMTGRYIAPAEGSGQTAAKGLKTGDLLSPEQLRNIERHLQNGMKSIVDLTGREIKQTGKAIDAYYNSLAKQNGMTMEEFRKGTSSWAEFSKRLEGARRYNDFERQHTTYDPITGIGHRDKAVNPESKYRGWDVFRVDKMGQNSYNDLVNLIKQQQQQQSQMYSTIGQAYRTINRTEGVTVKSIMGGGSGGGSGKTTVEPPDVTGSIDEQTKKVQELQKAWRAAADDDSRQKIKKEIDEAQYALDRITGNEKFDPSKVASITDNIGKTPMANLTQGAELTLPVKLEIKSPVEQWTAEIERLKQAISGAFDPAEVEVYQKRIDELQGSIDRFEGNVGKAGEDSAKSMQKAAGAISNVGSALQGIEDPGVKVAGIIASAIANIALAFSSADLKEGKSGNIWSWIAATASGMATMVATISQIRSATRYAEGGIVKGNSYSGDNISANGGSIQLDAGELILNRSQQSTLASQLRDGGGLGGLNLTTEISAESLRIVLNNNGRRTMQGELLTTRRYGS